MRTFHDHRCSPISTRSNRQRCGVQREAWRALVARVSATRAVHEATHSLFADSRRGFTGRARTALGRQPCGIALASQPGEGSPPDGAAGVPRASAELFPRSPTCRATSGAFIEPNEFRVPLCEPHHVCRRATCSRHARGNRRRSARRELLVNSHRDAVRTMLCRCSRSTGWAPGGPPPPRRRGRARRISLESRTLAAFLCSAQRVVNADFWLTIIGFPCYARHGALARRNHGSYHRRAFRARMGRAGARDFPVMSVDEISRRGARGRWTGRRSRPGSAARRAPANGHHFRRRQQMGNCPRADNPALFSDSRSKGGGAPIIVEMSAAIGP